MELKMFKSFTFFVLTQCSKTYGETQKPQVWSQILQFSSCCIHRRTPEKQRSGMQETFSVWMLLDIDCQVRWKRTLHRNRMPWKRIRIWSLRGWKCLRNQEWPGTDRTWWKQREPSPLKMSKNPMKCQERNHRILHSTHLLLNIHFNLPAGSFWTTIGKCNWHWAGFKLHPSNIALDI